MKNYILKSDTPILIKANEPKEVIFPTVVDVTKANFILESSISDLHLYFELSNKHNGLTKALEEMFGELKASIDQYITALEICLVSRNDYTKYPKHFISADKKVFDMIDQICGDAELIMSLIKNTMNNNDVYHHILYNTLSIEERFIIGMVTYDNIIEKYSHIRFYNYRYETYYKESDAFYDEERLGKIPLLMVGLLNEGFSSMLSKMEKKLFPEFSLINADNDEIHITECDLIFDNLNNEPTRIHKELKLTIPPAQKQSFEIYDDISNIFLKKVNAILTDSFPKQRNFSSSIGAKYNFKFKKGSERIFTFSYPLVMRCYDQVDRDIQISITSQ